MKARWLAGLMMGIVPAILLTACDSTATEDEAVAQRPGVPHPSVEATHVHATEGGTYPVAQFADPVVAQPGYAVTGHVTLEAVEGSGYLEMWSVFPDGSRFFSRTLATEGPMRALTGSGSWDFELPLFLEGATSPPNLLEINVVLPGAGDVWVENLALASLNDLSAAQGAPNGTLWGWAGAALGTVGALIGGLSGRLKARRFVLGTLTAMAALGLVLLVIGTVVWLRTGSVGEAYGFLLMGVIAAAVGAGSLPSIRRRYADNEMRRMQAMDVA
jgi:hypothetical protein